MVWTDILIHDALGEPYEEPRYVEDELAGKAFTTKEIGHQRVCEAPSAVVRRNEADLPDVPAQRVPVTVVSAIKLNSKDIQLKALSARAPVAAEVIDAKDDDGSGRGQDEDEDAATSNLNRRRPRMLRMVAANGRRGFPTISAHGTMKKYPLGWRYPEVKG
jgi:hypothetical protein